MERIGLFSVYRTICRQAAQGFMPHAGTLRQT